MNRLVLLMAPMLALGCKRDKEKDPSETGTIVDDSGTTDDTDPPTDDSGTPTDCTLTVDETEPQDGEGGWFYRDPLALTFNEDGKAATIEVLDGKGNAVAHSVSWSDGNFQAEIDAELVGSTDYTLRVTACEVTTDIAFTTDEYGMLLKDDVADLVGKTYLFDLGQADFVEPPGVGPVIELYVDSPLLMAVTAADDKTIDWIGAQGRVNGLGEYFQQPGVDTFDFPKGDFSAQPFFQAASAAATIDYGDDVFDFYDFNIEGTFAPDASSVGGAVAAGLADTANLGPAMKLGDEPYAVCNFLGKVAGIECETCPGGKKLDTCLYLVVEFQDAPHLPTVTIQEKPKP